MKSGVITYCEKKEGGITGSHERGKTVEQAPLEADWTFHNMVVVFCSVIFFLSHHSFKLANW